jgi:hypothetical protein
VNRLLSARAGKTRHSTMVRRRVRSNFRLRGGKRADTHFLPGVFVRLTYGVRAGCRLSGRRAFPLIHSPLRGRARGFCTAPDAACSPSSSGAADPGAVACEGNVPKAKYGESRVKANLEERLSHTPTNNTTLGAGVSYPGPSDRCTRVRALRWSDQPPPSSASLLSLGPFSVSDTPPSDCASRTL